MLTPTHPFARYSTAMPAVATKIARKRGGRSTALPRPAAKPDKKPAGSLYERCRHLIGTISGPGDLSTNPRYMEGYGKSRRP